MSVESSRHNILLPFAVRKLKGNVEVHFHQYRCFILRIKTIKINSHNFRSMPSCFRTCGSNNEYDKRTNIHEQLFFSSPYILERPIDLCGREYLQRRHSVSKEILQLL
jgi:hypothetical protein